MAREDYCIVSPATSAGAVIITTRDSAIIGISVSGSSAATVINIHKGVTTAGAKVAMFPVASALAQNLTAPGAGICQGGILATNVGTVTSYVVYFTDV